MSQEQDDRGLREFDLSKLKILVVEDLPQALWMMETILSVNHAKPMLAEGGAKALELIEQQRFDVVLLDIQMPDITGLEVVKHIRQHPDPDVRKTYVIAVTARAMPGDRETILAAGVDEYISKPIEPIELVRRLEKFIKP